MRSRTRTGTIITEVIVTQEVAFNANNVNYIPHILLLTFNIRGGCRRTYFQNVGIP